MRQLFFLLALFVGSQAHAFKVGDRAICVYHGVASWSSGNEFIEVVEIECKVKFAGPKTNDVDYGKNYQHLQMDCTKALLEKSSSTPGQGLVRGHKLNVDYPWLTSTECFKVTGR